MNGLLGRLIVSALSKDDGEDWKKESALMSSIYSFSMLNIAATHGKNGLAGCFSQRDPSDIARTVTKPPDGLPGHIYEFMEKTEEVWQTCVESAPLYKRGWVFQERMLAPRTIYFCKTQLIWGCHEERKFEGINGYIRERDNVAKIHWDVMVERYSRCQLSHDEDKFVAISGLARVKQRFLQTPYIAGLWENDLPRNLLWKTNIGPDNLAPSYPSQYRPPSWSWAAINGVSLTNPLDSSKVHPGLPKKSAARKMGNIENIVEVTNIYINNVNDPFGKIASGSITLNSGLTPLHLALEPSLSIIEGKEQKYKTVAQDVNLVGESYFDVRHRGDMEYFGMSIIGLWKRTSSSKNHVFVEVLLLLKVAGYRGTFRRLGTFTAFAPSDRSVREGHRVLREDDYLQIRETPHRRGYQQYVVRVI